MFRSQIAWEIPMTWTITFTLHLLWQVRSFELKVFKRKQTPKKFRPESLCYVVVHLYPQYPGTRMSQKADKLYIYKPLFIPCVFCEPKPAGSCIAVSLSSRLNQFTAVILQTCMRILWTFCEPKPAASCIAASLSSRLKQFTAVILQTCMRILWTLCIYPVYSVNLSRRRHALLHLCLRD
jgi:hypothetical protein